MGINRVTNLGILPLPFILSAVTTFVGENGYWMLLGEMYCRAARVKHRVEYPWLMPIYTLIRSAIVCAITSYFTQDDTLFLLFCLWVWETIGCSYCWLTEGKPLAVVYVLSGAALVQIFLPHILYKSLM
eukprot:GHVN01051892.1.p1 GENE.GHVN01051892.1~~GHVN01051892.1.p1  ORF type:complete len:129 (+),score=22.50 GHVN01051892.1:194-580(+)